jgi:hypothetical protein
MRQKNIHGYPLMVPSLSQTVYSGEIVEHDDALPGFEEVAGESELEADEKPADAERSAALTSPETSTDGDLDEPPPDAGHLATFTDPASTAATPGADSSEVPR